MIARRNDRKSWRRFLAAAVILPAVSFLPCGCRNSNGSTGALTVIPNSAGVNGCRGPDQVFVPPQAPVAVPLSILAISSSSQITAAGAGEMLYATGAGGQIVAIDVSGPTPAEVELVTAGVGPGTVSELLASAGIVSTPSLSGIAVLDDSRLVVVEQTSNTILSVLRLAPFTVDFYAGVPSETPGFSDGIPAHGPPLARFSFGVPCQICPTGDVPPRVFVADAGNHAVRLVAGDSAGNFSVRTLAGDGLPLFNDGDLSATLFDTPTGLSVACNGAVIVSERGDNLSGERIRKLEIGQPSPFGGFFGSSTTIAGDGTNATTAGGGGLGAPDSQVSRPVSPLVTSQGEVYWVDSGSGVLRRMKLDGSADCPLDVDCDQAAMNPSFPPGHELSLTETPGGVLFVLDATVGVLYRVTP